MLLMEGIDPTIVKVRGGADPQKMVGLPALDIVGLSTRGAKTEDYQPQPAPDFVRPHAKL